jgi:CheY-like chemotaxis protein
MEKREGQSPASRPTILVVDDELSIIKLCKALLEGVGFSVLGTDSSSDALKICTQHPGPIDLLLADLVLPPPGFQLASSANEFPHVNGQELAVRARMIRSRLRVRLTFRNNCRESGRWPRLVRHGSSSLQAAYLKRGHHGHLRLYLWIHTLGGKLRLCLLPTANQTPSLPPTDLVVIIQKEGEPPSGQKKPVDVMP